MWTKDIDVQFLQFLEKEFFPYRSTISTKTRAIATESDDNYSIFSKNFNDVVKIADPVFDMANEIIIYDNDRVAILLYSSAELSAVVVESKTLHDSLWSIFEIMRKAAKVHKL